jgi:hypothetical protein
MTEENSQPTEPQAFGWIAGVPTGLQDHPETRRAFEERRRIYEQQQQNPENPESPESPSEV